MKVFLIMLSTLCLCGILLCFWAYATKELLMPKTTQDTSVAAVLQSAGMQTTVMSEDSLCSPCEERIALMLDMMKGWELENTSSPAARGWVWLSSEQREQAQQLIDQYGTEEGLRRLRASEPEAAQQFEQKRSELSVRSASDEEPSTQ